MLIYGIIAQTWTGVHTGKNSVLKTFFIAFRNKMQNNGATITIEKNGFLKEKGTYRTLSIGVYIFVN